MLGTSNRPRARPILKLLARLLPELYSTWSNYYYKLDNYRLTHSASELSGFTCTSLLTAASCGIETFEFIVSEQ